MNIEQWAERECKIACKKENPNYDFDGDSFDYGCSCYKSALKAYKSLCEDNHSGMSFGFTKKILIRLMDGLPLTPITDDDFIVNEDSILESEEHLKKMGMKSDIQCSRMSSLFRHEYLDGTVRYTDVNRCYFIDVEHPSDTYGTNSKFLDEMFPITMPYYPSPKPYKVYQQTFLTNRENGDFDTRGTLYVITPDGERVDVNIFETTINGVMTRISKEEYDKLLENRIDKINEKVASQLMWTLIENSSTDEEIEKRRRDMNAYRLKGAEFESDKEHLESLCKFFENEKNWKYNTFAVHQDLCEGRYKEKYSDIHELLEIGDFLQDFLDKIKKCK